VWCGEGFRPNTSKNNEQHDGMLPITAIAANVDEKEGCQRQRTTRRRHREARITDYSEYASGDQYNDITLSIANAPQMMEVTTVRYR
jgi:hypothetical protein